MPTSRYHQKTPHTHRSMGSYVSGIAASFPPVFLPEIGVQELQWNPSIRTPRYRGQFLPSQILHLCTFQPLKSGLLANQDTFWGPQGVRIRGVPLYVTLSFSPRFVSGGGSKETTLRRLYHGTALQYRRPPWRKP